MEILLSLLTSFFSITAMAFCVYVLQKVLLIKVSGTIGEFPVRVVAPLTLAALGVLIPFLLFRRVVHNDTLEAINAVSALSLYVAGFGFFVLLSIDNIRSKKTRIRVVGLVYLGSLGALLLAILVARLTGL